MPSETTPLIQTVIVTPARPRYSHSYVRRFCTAALSLTLVVILILFLVPARYLPGNPSESEWWFPWRNSHRVWSGKGVGFRKLIDIILDTPTATNIEASSKYYTAGPHLAGQNYSQALWTKEKWQTYGIESHIETYEVYLNYPDTHRLALLEVGAAHQENDGQVIEDYQVKFEASLEEDVLEEDPTSGLKDRIPTFHGYGANGNATGRYVYVNRGTYADFEDLVKANVSLKGNIAVAKYGRIFRGLKVKRAEELGMIGVIIYSDPEEDGEIVEQNGYKAYPKGPARNPSAVQRGSVQSINILSGDPTTPGYASKPGVPRQDPSYALPSIPSQPISYKEAIPILRALNGHGPKASDFNKYWQGGRLDTYGVHYNIGPSPPDLQLHLEVHHEYKTTPIWDVIGVVNGTIADEVVVLGNHRDAWIAGGASDPNSGSAGLNELVRSFGVALAQGWKPLRTIIFASWDGEEHALLGSTEWVEDFMPWLKETTVAYLNVDVGTKGTHFTCSASPLLNQAIYHATSLVRSPNETVADQSIKDTWDGHIGTMGSGSDFTSFQDFAGIPSVDMGFDRGSDEPVYHYHSNYDSFAWMSKYGDKGWHYHLAAAKTWGVLAAHLIQEPIIRFNVTDYASALQIYLSKIHDAARGSEHMAVSKLEFPTLSAAISDLQKKAVTFDLKAEALAQEVRNGVPWWRWWRRASLFERVRNVNRKYKFFERQFLYEKGLDRRHLFKHVVFAPGYWTGYSGATFPGLIESVEAGDEESVEVSTSYVDLINIC